jgi:hypothetical protein
MSLFCPQCGSHDLIWKAKLPEQVAKTSKVFREQTLAICDRCRCPITQDMLVAHVRRGLREREEFDPVKEARRIVGNP